MARVRRSCGGSPLPSGPEKKGPHADLDGGSSGLRRKPRRIQPVLGSPGKGRERGDRGAQTEFLRLSIVPGKGDAMTRLTASR